MKQNENNRIFRTKRDKNFTILNNQIFHSDNPMSFRAIGLLCYLLHLPDDWNITKVNLRETFNEGRHVIDITIEELMLRGYVLRVESPREKGQFQGFDYYVYDEPVQMANKTDADLSDAVEPLAVESVAAKPEAAGPLTDNQHLIKTYKKSTNKTSTKNKKEIINQNDCAGAAIVPPTESVVSDNTSAPNLEDNPKGEEAQAHPTGAKIKDTLYPDFINVYHEWYKELNDGVPPKIDGAGGKAAKSMIAYLKTAYRTRQEKDNPGVQLTDEQLADGVLVSWKYIFYNWFKLDTFLATKTRLIDINSNFPNIITQIKNGAKKQPVTNDTTANDVKKSFSRIEEHYRSQQT